MHSAIPFLWRTLTAVLLLIASNAVLAYDDEVRKSDCTNLRQFTFSWQFIDQCGMKPRGGTSKGAGLQLDTEPSPGWLALQEPGISNKERDRRAILAMAGGFRTTFDFLEVLGFQPDYHPDPPYQSWGTEFVYVVEASENFISLQHIMVMVYENKDGSISQPIVQKHWRQDWRYEKRDIVVYAGNDRFSHIKYPRANVKGTWAQAVYQVDDSPRYEAIGKWVHKENFSTWISDETWRPVPRRESSFRKDYQVLIGTNRHTITPTGWVQEEENYKTRLDAEGKPSGDSPYLSKELGVNRYERVKNFAFDAGDQYWQLTNAYWRDVRSIWEDIKQHHKSFVIKDAVEGVPLFMPFFQMAEDAYTTKQYDSASGSEKIRATLQKYLEYADH